MPKVTLRQRVSKQNTGWAPQEASRCLPAGLWGSPHSECAAGKEPPDPKQLHFWVNGLLRVLLKPSCIIQTCHWRAWAQADSPKETSRTRLWNRTKQCHLVREKQGKILARTTRWHLALHFYGSCNYCSTSAEKGPCVPRTIGSHVENKEV